MHIDLSLKMQAGMAVEAGSILVRPKTLREIVSNGYSDYNNKLGTISLNVSDLVKGIENVDSVEEGATVFDLVFGSGDASLIAQFVLALAYFLDEDTYRFDDELGLVFGESGKVVNHENYNELADLIRYQNCVKMPKADSYNPKDEKARQIIEKLKKGKEQVEKAKQKKGSGDNIDFESVVSAVSTKSNSINKLNVWDLTIYQLYDEFKRLEMITGYDTSILAMLNGADIKDLKHWSSKMED
jgi:hypothetical protein